MDRRNAASKSQRESRDLGNEPGQGDLGQLIQNDNITSSLYQLISYGGTGLAQVPALLKRCLKESCWRRRYQQIRKQVIEFASFEDFVNTAPPNGLGCTVRLIKQLCVDHLDVLDLIDKETKRPVGTNQHSAEPLDNIQALTRPPATPAPTGTSRDAALRRLRKDRPDLHAKVVAKELTPHRAMVEAGFRTVPSTLELLQRLWKKAGPTIRKEFLEWTKTV
jgi:hypothetical protein